MKIALIVPASGFAKRFGQNKLLFPYNGKPLVQYALEAGLTYPFHRRVLVSQYESVRELGLGLGYHCLDNPDAASGLSASIRIGVGACKGCGAYMFLPGDQPFVSRKTLAKLADALESGHYDAACAARGGERFTPALLSATYEKALLALTGDKGGKAVLLGAKRVAECEAAEIETMDVDCAEDVCAIAVHPIAKRTVTESDI